jgi:protein SCO1/2
VKVHAQLGDRVGEEITMISISIDPEVDTPEQLMGYWQSFGSNPGWLYLTGAYDEIDLLRREMGVYDLDPVVDADRSQHAGLLTIGNDRTDRWTALPALMDVNGLVETIGRVTRD